MTKRLVCGCLVAVALLSACTSTRKNLGSYLQTNELVFIGQPEALPSRITPYTSMARAAKYNSDVAVKNIAEKIKKFVVAGKIQDLTKQKRQKAKNNR